LLLKTVKPPERNVKEIRLEKLGHVATITLCAPERRNAFLPSMVLELLEACNQVDDDDSLGACAVMAEGPTFCSGAHRDLLAEAGKDPASPANYRALDLAYRAFVRVGNLRVPTIAAVRGSAVGAGVNLVLATDMCIMSTAARLIPGFLRIGIHPGGGHFALMNRAGGRGAAAAAGLFGQELTASRAVELGIAWEALPESDVEARALQLATIVAEDPELARAATRSFRLETGPAPIPWEVALETERAAQMWSLRRRADRTASPSSDA
jgi:enoyl-CoA hydratase